MSDETRKEKYDRASLNIHVQAESVNKAVIELVIRMGTHLRHKYVSLIDILSVRRTAVPSTDFIPSMKCIISFVIWTNDKSVYYCRRRQIISFFFSASIQSLWPKFCVCFGVKADRAW